jgi:DNA-binding transcriptional LysR family regulator
MDLRHTRTFVTVAELGTVSKAAQRLRIAQPALSRQISALEQELGIKLFDRVGRRLLLTGEGEQLLGDCRGLLSYASAIGERAQLLRHRDTGVLKVAASSQNLESVIANFLHRYAQRYPNVQVKLFDAIGPELLAMLERGEVHVGQSSVHAVQPDDQRFGSLPLAPVEILAACHPSVTLGRNGKIEIGRLAPYPLFLQDPAFVVRRVFDAASRLAGLRPNILLESRAPHTLLAMAEAGHGVAIIPSALSTHRYKLRIVGVTYRGKALREPLIILWDKRRPLPPYATAFCEMVAEHFRRVFPITKPSAPAVEGRNERRAGGRREILAPRRAVR